jgi:hypothetical protein
VRLIVRRPLTDALIDKYIILSSRPLFWTAGAVKVCNPKL